MPTASGEDVVLNMAPVMPQATNQPVDLDAVVAEREDQQWELAGLVSHSFAPSTMVLRSPENDRTYLNTVL